MFFCFSTVAHSQERFYARNLFPASSCICSVPALWGTSQECDSRDLVYITAWQQTGWIKTSASAATQSEVWETDWNTAEVGEVLSDHLHNRLAFFQRALVLIPVYIFGRISSSAQPECFIFFFSWLQRWEGGTETWRWVCYTASLRGCVLPVVLEVGRRHWNLMLSVTLQVLEAVFFSWLQRWERGTETL